MRLPVNLAAQPIESVRQARRLVGRAWIVLIALTVIHGLGIVWVTRDRDVEAQVGPAIDPATLSEWQAEVEALAEVADVQRARAAVSAVDLGNQLIAWRTIPWDAIFADLEEVLPDRVKLETVQPGIDVADVVVVSIVAAARDTGPLQDLLIRLEAHPAFSEVYPLQETTGLDGLERMTLEARYTPSVAPSVAAQPEDVAIEGGGE